MTVATTANKTFFESQDFSSGNTLAQGDFLIYAFRVSSHSGTSYPQVQVNLELQYT